MERKFKKFLSIVLAMLMIVAAMPLTAIAEQGASITISSDVTASDIDIDKDVAFTYDVTIDNLPYNGKALGSDGNTYDIKDGKVTVPYDVSIVISNVSDGSTYSVKRLEYDNDKYALIGETAAQVGDISTKEYYAVSNGERTKITADEYNKATDNGANLSVIKYVDSNGNAYDEADIKSMTGWTPASEKVLASTKYSFDETEYLYVADSIETYPLTWKLDTSYKSRLGTYTYTGNVTISVDNFDLDTTSFSESATGISTKKASARTNLTNNLESPFAKLAYQVIQDNIANATGKTTTVERNVTSDYAGITWSDNAESYTFTANSCAFTAVEKQLYTYETEDAESDKNLVFDATLSPAPTGTFSIDFILDGGTVPESYNEAEFEITDILGNPLTAGEDYNLEVKNASVDLKVVEIGYTQYIFSGLKHGYYSIRQTKGAPGYIVDTDSYSFEVQRVDGAVVGENFAASSFNAFSSTKYTALSNGVYSIDVKISKYEFKVFKNSSFSLEFTKVDQNGDIVEGAQFMMIERDALIDLVKELISAGAGTLGNLDLNKVLEQLQGTDWSNIDITTIIELILSIVNLDEIELSEITIPALLSATSNADGIVSFNNSSNILNLIGALTENGVTGQQLAELLQKYLGNVIPESLLPYLDLLASFTGQIYVHTGIPTGEYIMFETSAPAGYEKSSLMYTVNVSAEGTAVTSAGIITPAIVEAINSRFGIDLSEILVNEEEFEKYKDVIGGAFDTFEKYSTAVIDAVVAFIGGINDGSTAATERLEEIKQKIIDYNEQYDDLAIAIGQTVKDLNSRIVDDMTTDWRFYDTRIYVDVNINIKDCQGNPVDNVMCTVSDSDGAQYEVSQDGKSVSLPFGIYSIGLTAPDNYVAQADNAITSVAIDDETGEYAFDVTYHNSNSDVVEESATCTEDGVITTTVVCELCNEEFSNDKVVLPATGHSWDDVKIIKEASCTETGIMNYTCQNDASHTRDEVIAKVPHNPDDAVNEIIVEPTCTTDGIYDEVVYCTECGNEISREHNLIEKLGHNCTATVTEPTCTEQGYTTYECVDCADTYVADYVPANGHTPGEPQIENKIDSSCTEKGSYDEVLYCTVCTAEISRQSQTTDANGHSFGEWSTVTSPSCTDNGSENRICNVCGYTETRGLDATGHSWAADYTIDVDSTCTTQGSKSIHCTVCDATKDSTVIAENGHSFSEWNTVTSPSCIDNGSENRICNLCGYTETRGLDATGHSWADDYTIDVDPTCTTQGSKSIHCTVCNATKDSTVIAENGHSFGEWNTVTSPSCIDNGSENRICNVCGYTETRGLDATGHSWADDYTVDAEPTCIDQGSKSIHCTMCDAVMVSVSIDALGHSGGKANCCYGAICDICGTEYGDIDYTNHIGDTEIRDDIAATDTEFGYTGDTYCKACNTIVAEGEEIETLPPEPTPEEPSTTVEPENEPTTESPSTTAEPETESDKAVNKNTSKVSPDTGAESRVYPLCASAVILLAVLAAIKSRKKEND